MPLSDSQQKHINSLLTQMDSRLSALKSMQVGPRFIMRVGALESALDALVATLVQLEVSGSISTPEKESRT